MSNLIKPIFAQINNPVLPNSGSIVSSPSTYVNSVIQSVISIFFIVAVLYFVWHFIMYAYHMISSQGNPDKWKEAQNSILYAFIGLLLVFAIFAILKFVGIIFGIPSLQSLQLTWPSL